MDRKILILKLADAIGQSRRDEGRNQYLLEQLNGNKDITNSDKLYLEQILDLEILRIEDNFKKNKPQTVKKDKTVFLNPNMVKCKTCEKEIRLEEKSSKYKNNWYHENCATPNLEKNETKIDNQDIQKEKH